eukprot:maker-scaffold_19-snap-gene-1.3-mRNA-1 protein AED:0.01 eAED:0.01 QI:97/1/1/1/1/1/2/41/97
MDVDQVEDKDNATRGPLTMLKDAINAGTQILVHLRNDHKLVARIKAYDRHCNMILQDVTELWNQKGKKKDNALKKREIKQLFVRGDSVVLVIKNPNV